jgi:nucleotide-binding universal stress UspA family protein
MTTLTTGGRPTARPALNPVPTDPKEEHLVLASDGGLASMSAMRWIADRARAHVLDLDVVVVLEDERVLGGILAGAGTKEARRAVEAVNGYLPWIAPSVRVSTSVLAGAPRATLQRLSASADLLVVGTNRVGPLSRLLLATFSTKLAEASECPTVVVPRGWEKSAGPVVVGVAGDSSDEAALDFAAHEAEVLRRRLVLVHARHLRSDIRPALTADQDVRDASAAHSAHLTAAEELVRGRHRRLEVVRVLSDGQAVQALIRAGEGASLLVVGTHELTVLDRMLLASVSRGVLERPPCPVVIVPPRRQSPPQS